MGLKDPDQSLRVVDGSSSEEDVARAAFPRSLRDDVTTVMAVLPQPYYPTHLGGVVVTVGEENIEIHGRMYRKPPDPGMLERLSPTQREIALCLFSQNANGFVRESSLRHLLSLPYEEWAVPFVVKLIGEYVPEICQVIADGVRERDKPMFVTFAMRNPRYMGWIRRAVISYWACFWRSKWRLHEYPGFVALTGC